MSFESPPITTLPAEIPSRSAAPAAVHPRFERIWAELLGRSSFLRSMGITGSRAAEGTSTIAAELFLAAGREGVGKVLLVDANLARPTVHRRFALPLAPGLAEAFADAATPQDIVQPIGDSLAVVAAGTMQDGQAVQPSLLEEFLATWRSSFDLVLFDLPPVPHSTLALRLAALCDGIILVVDAQGTPRQCVAESQAWIQAARGVLLGTVFNRHGTIPWSRGS